MSRSLRRPQQIFAIVMWLLSFLFAAALIGLGSLIIEDLPRVDEPLRLESFVDQNSLKALDEKAKTLREDAEELRRSEQNARDVYNATTADYNNARANFENWIKTRSATQQQAQDPEVIARTRAVEVLQTRQREALARVQELQTQSRQTANALDDVGEQRRKLLDDALPALESASNAQTLKIFLYRLALTLPLLLISGYFVARKRESSYWPLYRGFIIFALFAFFVELVPYLPDYGGYVRYIVGILLVLVVSQYAIRAMQRYLARKKEEESRSESERRHSIQYETALKKIAAKTCPGCDREIVRNEGVDTFFCVHCGIRLREKCGSCGTKNITFHRYCLSCGEPTQNMVENKGKDQDGQAAPA